MVHKVIEVGRHDKLTVNLAETLGDLLLGIEDHDLLQETRFAAARNVKRNITDAQSHAAVGIHIEAPDLAFRSRRIFLDLDDLIVLERGERAWELEQEELAVRFAALHRRGKLIRVGIIFSFVFTFAQIESLGSIYISSWCLSLHLDRGRFALQRRRSTKHRLGSHGIQILDMLNIDRGRRHVHTARLDGHRTRHRMMHHSRGA